MDRLPTNSPPSMLQQDGSEVPHSPVPRPQPTPDYGTLGPGSDIAKSSVPSSPVVRNVRLLHFAAMIMGIGLAVLVSSVGGPGALWAKIAAPFSSRPSPHVLSAGISERDLNQQKPQRQAEILLERAVSRGSSGQTEAEAQIEARLDGWRGKIKWDEELGQLTTAALNSDDRGVRASAIEVQLAAYGLTKNQSTVDALVLQAESSDHTRKIWALWALGLLGNRGVETDRIVQVLTAHLNSRDSGGDFSEDAVTGSDSDTNKRSKNRYKEDEDTRRWAVEGLALVGTTPTIAPLLDAMRNDPSPAVRESAACSLAQSGMLSSEQRLTAVPQLINDSDDPALDAQTRAWAFQALAEITKQRFPNDSAAWREWYQKAVINGQ